MTWQIEINDTINSEIHDITNQTLVPFSFAERLGQQVAEFNLRCRDILNEHPLNELKVYKDGVIQQGGVIVNQEDYREGNNNFTNFTIASWAFKLQFRLIAQTYEKSDAFEGKPDLIIKDIISRSASEFTTVSVKSGGPVIDYLQLRYETVFDAINKICELTGWNWYVDANIDIHFFGDYEAIGPTLKGDLEILQGFKKTIKAEKPINRVWMLGPRQASETYVSKYFTGQGRVHGPLGYTPNYTEVFLNDTPKTIKLEENDDGICDYLLDKKRQLLIIPERTSELSTDILEVKFKPTVEIVDYFQDASSVKKYGIYEKSIKNRDISDKLTARQFGRQTLKKDNKKRAYNIPTQSEVKVGQIIKIVTPKINTSALVIGVSTNIPDGKNVFRSVECVEV